jgi:hypothetical protein
VGLKRGPLSLVSTTEEQLGRKKSFIGLYNRHYGRKGSADLTTLRPLLAKVGTVIADKKDIYIYIKRADQGIWCPLSN